MTLCSKTPAGKASTVNGMAAMIIECIANGVIKDTARNTERKKAEKEVKQRMEIFRQIRRVLVICSKMTLMLRNDLK